MPPGVVVCAAVARAVTVLRGEPIRLVRVAGRGEAVLGGKPAGQAEGVVRGQAIGRGGAVEWHEATARGNAARRAVAVLDAVTRLGRVTGGGPVEGAELAEAVTPGACRQEIPYVALRRATRSWGVTSRQAGQ